MSFCGTIEHERRWRMVGFSMHCSGLAHQIFSLKHGRDIVDENGQTQLFQMTLEQREEFAKFAKNLRWLITEHKLVDGHSESYWQGYRDHEYTDYSYFELFDPFSRDKTEAVVNLLDKVGSGEQLSEEEIKQVMDFLHMLSARAHARTNPGGCF